MMGLRLSVTVFIFIIISSVTSAKKSDRKSGSSGSTEAKLFNSLLKRYNSQQPPDKQNATQVQVFIHISRISDIDSKKMVLTVDLYLKQQWFDKRLHYSSSSAQTEQMMRLSPEDSARIWHPDSFFRNLAKAEEFELPSQQKLTFLYSSGRVYTSHRMEVSLYCPMAFHKYPFDVQYCPITIETLATNMGSVILRWSPLFASAVELDADLGLTNQVVTKVSLRECSKQNYTNNAFSCLEFELVIARHLGLFLKHVYIPQLLLVCVCFFSFFAQTTLPRITLIIVCAITMITHAMTSQSPELPYYTGLDVWMTGQFVFLFAVVLEFGLVATPRRWLPQMESPGGPSMFYQPESEGANGNGTAAHMEELMEGHAGRKQKYVLTDAPSPVRHRVDLLARFIIPLSYIGFNVAYWLYYCLL